MKSTGQGPHILILAAGLGKRMHSKLPKVLHPVLFRPMLHHVLDTAYAISHRSVTVVVGHQASSVKNECVTYKGLQFVEQKEQRGTGDAVRTARANYKGQSGELLILSGDVILLLPKTLNEFLKAHANEKAIASLISAKLSDPKRYGRILRSAEGSVKAIREDADCSPAEKKILEVNSGIYCFDIPALFETLERVSNENRQGEFYLTDVIELLNSGSKRLGVYLLDDAREMEGINNREDLASAELVIQERVNRHFMQHGVTLRDPNSIFLDPRSEIGTDVTIEGGTVIEKSVIGEGVVIEAGSRIVNSRIGPKTQIKQGSYIEGSEVGPECTLGPYLHLRPGTRLDRQVKLGNFVEVKNSVFAEGSKASHLSYIGDADIGKNVNLGCGFVTCNYDGHKKHKTIIEDDVFVGSDSQTVAPVTIGRGSYVASGSTVTEDAPPDSLILSRGRQTTKPGYAKKFRK